MSLETLFAFLHHESLNTYAIGLFPLYTYNDNVKTFIEGGAWRGPRVYCRSVLKCVCAPLSKNVEHS